MQVKELATRRADLYYFKPSDVVVRDGWNARADYGDLDALRDSLIENGVKTPLRGYLDGNKIVITDGHRRFKSAVAAWELGHEILLPFAMESKGSSEADFLLTQVISNDGKPLEPLEQAQVFKRLIDYGWTEAQISKKTGRSHASVNNALLLLSQPEELKAMIVSGEVSASLVVNTARKQGKNTAAVITEAVQVAKREGKTRATQQHIKAPSAPIDETPGILLSELKFDAHKDKAGEYMCVPVKLFDEITQYLAACDLREKGKS